MTRIFLALALLAVGLLAANIVVGLTIDDYNNVFRKFYEARQHEEKLKQLSAPPAEVRTATSAMGDAAAELQPYKETAGTHLLLGLIAVFMTLLVNSITVTYFIGTSRWALEVVETYQLKPELAESTNRLKRAAFRWALLGIATAIAIPVFGAFSDPAASGLDAAAWVTPHLIAAILGTGLIGWALLMQAGKIGANYEVIERIVEQVQAIRAERGLDEEDDDEPGETEG